MTAHKAMVTMSTSLWRVFNKIRGSGNVEICSMIEVHNTFSDIVSPPWDAFHEGIVSHFDQKVQRYDVQSPYSYGWKSFTPRNGSSIMKN